MKSLGNADPALQRSLYKVLALSPKCPSEESYHSCQQTQQELQNEPRGGEGREAVPLSSSLLSPSCALHISTMTYIPWMHLLPNLHLNQSKMATRLFLLIPLICANVGPYKFIKRLITPTWPARSTGTNSTLFVVGPQGQSRMTQIQSSASR